MALRFNRRIRIAPGIRLNVGKNGTSVSVGKPGATVNVGKDGVRATTGIPGTGLSTSHQIYKASPDPTETDRSTTLKALSLLGIISAIFAGLGRRR